MNSFNIKIFCLSTLFIFFMSHCMDDKQCCLYTLIPIKYNLIDAIKRRHFTEAIRNLDEGADVNAPDRHGLTPLHWAAGCGYYRAVELLLNRGAQINNASEHFLTEGTTPLHLATDAGHVEVVKLLLERGAWVNQSGRSWNFLLSKPLDLAITNGNIKVAYYLLKKGAQKNYPVKPSLDLEKAEFISKMIGICGVLGIPGLWSTLYLLKRDIKAKRGSVEEKQHGLKIITSLLTEKLEEFDKRILVEALAHKKDSLVNQPEIRDFLVSSVICRVAQEKEEFSQQYETILDYYLAISRNR